MEQQTPQQVIERQRQDWNRVAGSPLWAKRTDHLSACRSNGLSPQAALTPLMGKSDEYKDFVLDQLADLHGLTCRAMFGGHGLSFRGTFFGIIHRGRLYFKTHPATVSVYRAKKMKPFKPNASQILKHYYEVPVEIVESPEDLAEWAMQAAQP